MEQTVQTQQMRPPRPPAPRWTISLTSKTLLNPRMMRLRFTGDTLDAFPWIRGQDVVIHMPQKDGEPLRRHYTIRHHDSAAKIVDIDFVLHGESPAGNFVKDIKEGDAIEIAGPRGRTVFNAAADWHLFFGDETCIPAIFAILENLPANANATAFIEVGSESDKQVLKSSAKVDLRWLSRNGARPAPSDRFLRALEGFSFPPGRGQAYVIGETSNVRELRHKLLERGFAKDQIAAEGYWRPGRVGGHDHI